jgi:hypothetical protein
MSNSLEQNKKVTKNTVDLNKHIDTSRLFRAKNQEETIQTILIREFYHNNEYEISNEAPKIYVPDLAILGYKKPEKAVKSLIDRGVVKELDNNIIELVTKQVYCNQCRNRQVFIWDRVNHMETFHYWDEGVQKHNVLKLEFSNKPFPEMIDHDYQAISELIDNQLEVKCKNCGYEKTVYIDNRKECDPFDKGIFIDNPEDEKDIKIRIGRNSSFTVLKNQEELKQFIQSKIKEIEQ